MKLQTSIPPRRDGTVRHTGQDRRTYVFEAGPDGELSCDVDDPHEVAKLLATGMFWPENPEDFEQALSIAKKPEGGQGKSGAGGDEDSDDGDDGEIDSDEADDADDAAVLTALPVEANTPPVRRKPGPKPKAK